MAIIATLVSLMLTATAAYLAPADAAPTRSSVPATAILIPLGTEAPADGVVNSTIIPLTTLIPGAPPPAILVTPHPVHPATSTPPPTSTANPHARTAIAGTPRSNTSSPPIPGATIKSTPTRAARVPGQFTRPPAVPPLPVVPAATAAPTVPSVPTPTLVYSFPTPTVAAPVTLATAIIVLTETATPSPTDTPEIGPLPTAVAAVSRDLTPRGTQTPFGPPDHVPPLVPARGGVGGVVVLALFVILLGGVGVAGGIWAIWRVRRETPLGRTRKIEEIR